MFIVETDHIPYHYPIVTIHLLEKFTEMLLTICASICTIRHPIKNKTSIIMQKKEIQYDDLKCNLNIYFRRNYYNYLSNNYRLIHFILSFIYINILSTTSLITDRIVNFQQRCFWKFHKNTPIFSISGIEKTEIIGWFPYFSRPKPEKRQKKSYSALQTATTTFLKSEIKWIVCLIGKYSIN